MEIFDARTDTLGNVLGDYVVVFIAREDVLEDGTIAARSEGDNATTDKTGWTFVIKTDDIPLLNRCKLINGELVEPE